VRPGWKPFGWGHGSLSAGLPLPVDADGLITADRAEGLRLDLRLPADVYVGEYVIAEVTLSTTAALFGVVAVAASGNDEHAPGDAAASLTRPARRRDRPPAATPARPATDGSLRR
jgi:hypothetical protein